MIGPEGTDLDVFYTLPTALGMTWDFAHGLYDRGTHEIELVGDVHRAHGIRNAILVVAKHAIDPFLRYCIAHAWREGVRRWILVFAAKSEPGDEFAECEQELRVLLDSLGDGGAAPAIRTALTRCAGRCDGMRPAMQKLLDEIERVFSAHDEPVVDAPLPASFAGEEHTLDAVLSLMRPATMVAMEPATLAETYALRDGNGGSHVRGWPYIEHGEAWPTCSHCHAEMPLFIQIDARDVLHSTPPAHRLFVVYVCDHCRDMAVVRHYAAPDKAKRQPPLEDDDEEIKVLVMERLSHHLPDQEIVTARHQALGIDEQTWWMVETALGMCSARIPDHLGGYETSQYAGMEPPCACGAEMLLVSSTQAGDYWRSIWACPEHPDETHYRFHK